MNAVVWASLKIFLNTSLRISCMPSELVQASISQGYDMTKVLVIYADLFLSMQYDHNKYELKIDTEHVFRLITCDPKFEGLLMNLTHQEAVQAVAEAFSLLHSAPGPTKGGKQLDLTPDGCMVVSLVLQLLIRLLTKRLMNLMSAEAVVLNRNKIPYSYLKNYLFNQAHFSLKDTIKGYNEALKATFRYTYIV